MDVDAIVLAGGAARRLGGADKASLRLGDRTLLGVTLDAVAGSGRMVVVGEVPHGLAGSDVLPASVVVVREDPPLGGPAAAIGAGLAHVTAPHVLVLACDMPQIARVVPVLLAALAAAPPRAPGVLARDGDRTQYLAGIHRTSAVRAAVAARGDLHGASVRSLLSHPDLLLVDVPPGSTHDIDTWADATQSGVTP